MAGEKMRQDGSVNNHAGGSAAAWRGSPAVDRGRAARRRGAAGLMSYDINNGVKKH